MSNLIIKSSIIDKSVNFIYPATNIGKFESRFVRREDKYFIIYVSSQSGCDQACRMCHLTATGQNKYEDATLEDFLQQAESVYSHYDLSNTPAEVVHYNFMARGEPLNNPVVLNNSGELFSKFNLMAANRKLEAKYLISTIMPSTMKNKSLVDIFKDIHPDIYYSIYSTDDKFRKKWLAKALPHQKSLELLKEWQVKTGKVPKIHFAFIKDENDSEENMYNIAKAVNEVDLKVNVNIVRYNPYSAKYGEEPHIDIINRNTKILSDLLSPDNIRIVPKVGFDVKASCGMFVGKD